MHCGSRPPPGPAPAGLTFWEPEVLGGKLKNSSSELPPSCPQGASRPGVVLEAPGGPWAGPARGQGSWGRARLAPRVPG